MFSWKLKKKTEFFDYIFQYFYLFFGNFELMTMKFY